jgi:hypothetical protein
MYIRTSTFSLRIFYISQLIILTPLARALGSMKMSKERTSKRKKELDVHETFYVRSGSLNEVTTKGRGYLGASRILPMS